MKSKISRGIVNIIILSYMSVTTMYASSNNDLNNNKITIPIDNIYQNMSTAELQKKVEELSKDNRVPFVMGLELIKRWTKG